MLELKDYKKLADTCPIAMIVVSPLYNDTGLLVDFVVEYANTHFLTFTNNCLTEGSRLSVFTKTLESETNWYSLAEEVLRTEKQVQSTFYSSFLNKWLNFSITRVSEKLVSASILDVSIDKEYEQQLKNQNLRLASLTDELSLNKSILRNKISGIQALNEQLQFAAYHDTLTNLYNRASFNKHITAAVEKALNTNTKFGILIIDIDDMKNINDARGHSAGDEVIRRVAATLRKLERDSISVYRFGGDEFIMLAENLTSKNNMITIGDTLTEMFSEDGISVSGGIAVYPDDSTQTEELLSFADMAMFEVKKNHKNNIIFFHQLMQQKFLNKMSIEEKLTDAISSNLFQLYFQPQFDVSSGILRGFEALLRWHDDELGWVSPEQFIPLAEESRLVIPLGEWVIDTAIKTLKHWEDEYHFEGIMSLNVSPVQLQKPDFLDMLMEKVRTSGVDPRHLEVEITEGVLIDNMEEAIEKLKVIRDMHIGVSLDDFGTGYSSLRYLQILPLTTLKIDKSFIASINSDSGIEANITNCIVSMVNNMGLDTIAEGVETNEQLSVLKEINCKNIQGFLKGKPMPLEQCEKVLAGDDSALLTIANDPKQKK